MTSESGVEPRFHFRCSCGADIETTDKKEICPACGKSIEVLGCIEKRQGKKYVLRITKRRNDWNTAAPLWPLGRGSTTTRATQHQHETPLYERLPGSVDTAWPKVEPETRFRRLGFLILLIGAVFIVLASIFGSEDFAVLTTPKPSDCDWSTRPLGNKHCHYKSIVMRAGDDQTQIKVTWERVIDY
ncbi:MAG TPA: hypothetical protein VFE61_31455 [Candidatus Sulfotelmatobacter sp.]|nr:hypothetical protein [Candidatus Sulfotelmatobacter sp.]